MELQKFNKGGLIMEKKLSIITGNIEKGGTGKTTTIYNLGGYAVENLGMKVLYIDEDKSQNLSKRFPDAFSKAKRENTINHLYLHGSAEPLAINENMDILVAGEDLKQVEMQMRDMPNNRTLLFRWIVVNYEQLKEKYNLILIDTHNDAGLLAQNAWAVSDLVVGISDPSKDGFEALLKLGKDIDALAKQLIDIKTGETLMETKYATIGSRIKHNTNSSREFLELVPTLSNYLGYVQEKELLNATSLEGKNIAEFAKDKNIYRKNKDFFESTFTLYNKIIDTAQE
ncbi:hypothetical protein HMPREF1367_00475 [Enterococcus faecium ERV38]|nr:hypothetical protein HMPREF1368_00316 [Enterococcus faecium ERV69]EJX91833.1 hypothetical protein HMPREF1367_00475 [Enterococcus faecium ERV38]